MDPYSRVTQLLPAALVLAPLSALALLVLWPDNVSQFTRSAVGLLVGAGLHLVVMRIVRDRGNAVQQRLWSSWGGKPTLQRLRWGRSADPDPNADVEIKRLHRHIHTATGIQLPDRVDEQADPAWADGRYEEAVIKLQEMTRDHDRYPRVWSELKQYGVARNLYGLRMAGAAVAAVASMFSAVLVASSLTGRWPGAWWMPAGTACVALLVGVIWIFVISEAFVRIAADRYADALLATSSGPSTNN